MGLLLRSAPAVATAPGRHCANPRPFRLVAPPTRVAGSPLRSSRPAVEGAIAAGADVACQILAAEAVAGELRIRQRAQLLVERGGAVVVGAGRGPCAKPRQPRPPARPAEPRSGGSRGP